MKKAKRLFFQIFSYIDQYVKFPSLKKGEIGIQVGFDMFSPVTSDLFAISRKVGEKGVVYGIDPDSWNHAIAREFISQKKIANICLLKTGTYSEKKRSKFLLRKRSSWSQIGNIPIDETVDFSDKEIEIQLETLDDIIEQNGIDVKRIGHFHITNNVAEYYTLVGFKKSL